MRIITVLPVLQKHKGYAKAVFIVSGSGDIYTESAATGFIKRDDMTIPRLVDHIERMKKEGFSVTEQRI